MEISLQTTSVIVLIAFFGIYIPNVALHWDGGIRKCISVYGHNYIILAIDEDGRAVLSHIWDLTNSVALRTYVSPGQMKINFFTKQTYNRYSRVRYRWGIYNFGVFYIRGILHIFDTVRYFVMLMKKAMKGK